MRDIFTGFYAKYLSAVDANPERSHQHEIGSNQMAEFLGHPNGEKKVFAGKFMYIPEDGEDIVIDEGKLTWYDTRWNQRHKRGPEYRLYYQDNSVTKKMAEGDFIIIAGMSNGDLLLIITPKGSTAEAQLQYLFELELEESVKRPVTAKITNGRDISVLEKIILENIGVEVEEKVEENLLDMFLAHFKGEFPETKEFSKFAREVQNEVDPVADADRAFLEWFRKEEELFKALEKYKIEQRLEKGFQDVDDFIKYSLSVQNRRKSRAGHAAENHLEEIFRRHNLKFSRGEKTENRSKPDFLFPGIKYYHDENFPEALLTMLGVKTSCKDRWRQILSEAKRIRDKHLFTLEPAISVHQTDEMEYNRVRLVVPEDFRKTYKQEQKVMNLSEFISFVKEKQQNAHLR